MMLSNNFKSQCGEDVWIDSMWERFGLPDRGYFCEFGAMDGEHLSNTYWLEKARGWTGLLVEPDPRQTIQPSRLCPVARCAVGPKGVADIGLADDDWGYSGEGYRSPKRAQVPRVPLSELLDEHGIPRLDFVSIDTEGTEVEAWKTLDLRRHKPIIAVIELVTYKMPSRREQIIGQLANDGYRLIRETLYNGIFTCARWSSSRRAARLGTGSKQSS